jgi:putative membrane protein
MQYMVFVVSVVIGGWMGYPVSGFIIGLALWYGIIKIQGKPSAENEQLKAEIADLQRRVHALELQLSRPSENVLPTAQEEEPHPSAIPDAMPIPSAAEPALETAAAVSPTYAANETEKPQAARVSRLQQMHLQAEEAAAVENRPSESDSADRFQTASFVEAEQGQAAARPAYYDRRPSEKEAATDGGGSLLTRLTGGNLLLKTGIVVLFLGLAFLLRYASERIHIPIGLRYLSVAGGGLAAVVAGWKLQSRRREYGLILQGFGVAVMYLTSLAALKLHPLLPAPVVFAAMVVLVAAMAVMAVRQDAQIMAQAAVIGGMAAPILVSDGSGNYLVLFSYLSLLNTGIAAIARFKAWRPLNLTGFVCTFCIALFWGLKSYTPGHFYTTEPFLIYHWLLYTLIACLFARRRLSEGGGDALPPLADNAPLGDIIGHIAKHGIRVHILDHTLLFGTMTAAFALQCGITAHLTHGSGWSAVLFATVYGAAALVLRGSSGLAVLRQAFAACALLFATVAVPLFFNRGDTVSLWSLEAVLLYFFGLRGRLPHLRFAALSVYLSAAVCQLGGYSPAADTLLSGSWADTLFAAAGGGLLYACWHKWRCEGSAAWERGFQTASLAFAVLYASLLPMLLLSEDGKLSVAYSALALLWAACQYRKRQPVFTAAALLCGLTLIFFSINMSDGWPNKTVGWLLQAVLLFAASFAAGRPKWQNGNKTSVAALCAGSLLFTISLLPAHTGWQEVLQPLEAYGTSTVWLLSAVWLLPFALACSRLNWRPPLFILLFFSLLTFTGYPGAAAYSETPLYAAFCLAAATAVHWYLLKVQPLEQSAADWLHGISLLLFAAAWTHFSGTVGALWLDGVWLQVVWLAVPLAFWLLLAVPKQPALFRRHPAAYLKFGGIMCALFAAGWLLWVNISAPHRPAPLPYLPLLNPLELASVGLLWLGWRGFERITASDGWSGTAKRQYAALLNGLAFIVLSAGVMRLWHFFDGIRWRLDYLLASFGLQASLSVVWAVTAIVLMVGGNRNGRRSRWLTGATLMAVVVVKLFLVELGNSGGIARIVSFIAVGLLLLLVGWFAPVPPKENILEEAKK